MKDAALYVGYIAFAFLSIKAYYQFQYYRQRRKTGTMFLRWIIVYYALSVLLPITSIPTTEKEFRLKKITNVLLMLFYLCGVIMFVLVYVIYGS